LLRARGSLLLPHLLAYGEMDYTLQTSNCAVLFLFMSGYIVMSGTNSTKESSDNDNTHFNKSG